MKFKKSLFAIFLLVMLVVAGCGTSSSGSSTPPSQIFQNVVTLSFLKDLGILTNPIDPIEGFTRFLLLILLFAILFKGAELLRLGTNISIVIALAISLITVIFIPGTVLLAVGTSYGTLFSLIILAVPIGLILLGYFLLKEHPWLRVIMMGLVWYLLSQMWRYIQTWTGSATAAYATVIHTIANLIGWVEIVVAVFFFINLLQALFSFTTGHTGDRTDVKGVANWVANKVGNRARRKKTALLNSYIEEERELKLLDSAVEAKELALDEVNKIIRAGEVTDVAQKDALVAAVKQVQTKLDDARREFRLVKGRTWRSQTKFTNLVKEFKDKEKDVRKLDVLEKEVLKKHEEAITALDGALGKVSDLVRNVELVGKSVTAYPFPLNGPIANQRVKIKLVGLKTGLVALDVKTAEDAQKEAIQAVQGIVTEARELMKVNW